MSNLLRNPLAFFGFVLFATITLLALAAPLLPLYPPDAMQLAQRLLPPLTDGHLLGTDLLGRDILSRLIWGTRTSLAVAAVATIAASIVGSAIGISAGYFGRWIDTLFMRGIDLVMAFPYLILALAIVAALGPGLLNALIAIAIVNVPFFARTTRGVALGLTRQDFVTAARLGGQGHGSILVREILPNVLPTIIITMSTTLGWMILETAGLSFLGLGAQPPQADLGSMLAESRELILIAPHAGLLPGLVILLLVIGINLFGDGLRDALDPRLKSAANARPRTATTVTCESSSGAAPAQEDNQPILIVDHLTTVFDQRNRQPITAVNDVSFTLDRGETLGLVGESGSGKSVTAMSILRLVPSPPGRITAGRILFNGQDVLTLQAGDMRNLRGNRIAVIFQDPLMSLHPLMPVGRQITEALQAHQPGLSRDDVQNRARELLERVHIPRAKERLRTLPHELSGGQRQRVGIAMALANKPDLLIADEPTTALDVTVQKEVLELLRELRDDTGLALLFISHDLGVVEAIADRTLVMNNGRIVEDAPTQEIVHNPRHPYTRHLIAAAPVLGQHDRRLADDEWQPEAKPV